MLDDLPDELRSMLADMASAEDLYRPTHFWQCGLAALLPAAAAARIAAFRSDPEALRFFVPQYGFPGYGKSPASFAPVRDALTAMAVPDARAAQWLEQTLSGETQAIADYRVLMAGDRPGWPHLDQVSESVIGQPEEQFVIDGRRVSRSFLNYALGLVFAKRHVPLDDVRTVLEIGGGFGTLGELLLGDTRNEAFWIDVDIPPTAFFASHYLRARFGEAAVATYERTREQAELSIDALRARHHAAVLCPWQLPKLTGRVDLFVNFISFQEMEPAVVENYLGHVARLGTRFVLLRNLREGKRAAVAGELGVRQPIRGADYDRWLPGFDLVATNTIPFGHRTVDGFHSELRLYRRR